MLFQWYFSFINQIMSLSSQTSVKEAISVLLQRVPKRVNTEISVFTRKASRISPIDYTIRFQNILEVSDQVIMAGCMIFEKVLKKGFLIPFNCSYRLMTVCVFIAQKLIQDEHNECESYSLASGIPKKQIVQMELSILELVQFGIWEGILSFGGNNNEEVQTTGV